LLVSPHASEILVFGRRFIALFKGLEAGMWVGGAGVSKAVAA